MGAQSKSNSTPEQSDLSSAQRRALDALLKTKSVAEAAKRARVAEKDLEGWLAEDEFRKAYLNGRRRLISQSTAHLQQLTAAALDALERVLSDEDASPTGRISAARLALQYAYRGVEVEDLARKVDQLEEAAAGRKRKKPERGR